MAKSRKYPTLLTEARLSSLSFYSEDIRRFRNLFPAGMEITEENLIRAVDEGISVFHLLQQLLTLEDKVRYMEKTNLSWQIVFFISSYSNKTEDVVAAWKWNKRVCARVLVNIMNPEEDNSDEQ